MRVIEQRKAFDLLNSREGEPGRRISKLSNRALAVRLVSAYGQPGSISSNCRCKFRKFRCAGETRGKMPALADAKANWRDEPVDIGVDGEMAGRVAAQGRLGPQDRPFSRVRLCDPLAFAASAAEELLKTFNHVARAVMDLRLPQRSWRCRHRLPCLSQQHPPPPRLHHSGAPACRRAVTRSWRSQRRYGPD